MLDEPTPAPPATLGDETRRRSPRISLTVRIVLHFIGWAVLLVGIAGLLLPGIQGVLTILAGAAILSVASDRVHRWLQLALRRWPRMRERLDNLRHKLHSKLSRKP